MTFGTLTAFFFFILAIVGAILPALPGSPFVLVGIVIYGFIVDFSFFDAVFGIGQVVLAAVAFFMDYIANVLGVKALGGSKAGMFGAILGVFVGMFAGPIGFVFGPVLGAICAELLTGKETWQAVRSGIGGLVGFLLGTTAKIFLIGIMIAWFLYRISPQIASCVNWI